MQYTPTRPAEAVSPRYSGIITTPDAFEGLEELKLKAPDGHRLMMIAAVAGLVDKELLDFLADWLPRRISSLAS